MAIERIIGIDFGTSTSVIRVKRYENGNPIGEVLETKEVIFGGIGATVPTLIRKKDDDESIVYYGYEAQQKREKSSIYQSFKVDLESSNPEKRAKARALTEEFFCYLAKTYQAQSQGGHLGAADDKERTIVSYPVKWSEDTRNFMLEAARKAGFPNATGMDEAQAAIQAVTVMSEDHLHKNGLLVNGTPSNILLIDMGAGTTDLVLCRYTPGEKAKAEILCTWPKDGEILFGGREVDCLLQNFFRDKMKEEDAERVFKRIGVDKFKSWKEEIVSPALMKQDSVSDFDALDTCVEMADIKMDEYCLDRAAFENCLSDYLKQLPRLINGCIENSGIDGSDADLVIVTGGHSQWYFVHDMLAGELTQFGEVDLPKIKESPSRIIPIARPQETVALGLAFDGIEIEFRAVEDPEDDSDEDAVTDTANTDDNLTDVDISEKIEYTPDSEFETKVDTEIDGSSRCFVTKYVGYREVVNIPPVIRGSRVIGISKGAFSRTRSLGFLRGSEDLSTIRKVIIPSSVISIGENAFNACRKLDTVIAHRGICLIGEFAFANCSSLSKVYFGVNDVTPGVVCLPTNLAMLGSYAFVRCDLISSIAISRNTKVNWPNFEKTGEFTVTYYEDEEKLSKTSSAAKTGRMIIDETDTNQSAGGRASDIIRQYFNKNPHVKELNGIYYGMVPDRLRKRTGVPGNETVLFSFDSSVLKNQSSGSVFTETGIYFKFLFPSEFISWGDIAAADEIMLFRNSALGIRNPNGFKSIDGVVGYDRELKELWEILSLHFTGKKCTLAGK